MNPSSYAQDPWGGSHATYKNSAFSIRPAPEYASSEVLVSSLYRSIGYEALAESQVPTQGRAFEKLIRKDGSSLAKGSEIADETWRLVVSRVLESPKLPNQATKPFLQMTPLVPGVALYSGSARRSGNSWAAGQLVARMVRIGSNSAKEADETWAALFEALSVGPRDDVWAQWLTQEFDLRSSGAAWTFAPLSDRDGKSTLGEVSRPARQFVADIEAVLAAKDLMTRAQWVSVLGAVVRLGAVAHVLWLCDVQDRLWRRLKAILFDGVSVENVAIEQFPKRFLFLHHGRPALPALKDAVSRYLIARLGINLVLWQLGRDDIELSDADGIEGFVRLVADARTSMDAEKLRETFLLLQEREARTLACKKGIGSNMIEFARHVLGQRQSSVDVLRGYDQGYFLKKKGTHSAAPWVVSMGPVALIALVHCCLFRSGGPRSIARLSAHLAQYGVSVGIDDFSNSDLGAKLRLLGLVLDSPDAESGMLLAPPFPGAMNARRGSK